MITISQKGDFKHTEKFLNKMQKSEYLNILNKYGHEGVLELALHTPADSGKTANSWSYKIRYSKYGASIIWENSNIVDGVPIAVLIQYGHGTRNGGYVEGRDYINPVMQPIFDKIADELWKEVTNL